MRLKKILKIADYSNILIWDKVNNTGDDDEDWNIVYDGISTEVPWTLVNRQIKAEDGIAPCYDKETNTTFLRITLEEEI